MPSTDPLVSIGLPVRNGEKHLQGVVRSVLAQDYHNLELVISDNASTDGTEEVCRELARADSRIVYHRQPENIGLMNNFVETMRLASGTFFRWVGDDDWLAPDWVSRCLEVFAADERLILVTTEIAHRDPDGVMRSASYHGNGLSSGDPVERFAEWLRLLNESYLLMDPMYGLMRRAPIVAIPRRNMLREDQIFAANMALAGPWGHLPEVLAKRGWKPETRPGLARRLDVPAWQAHAATVLQCREMLRCVRRAELDPAQRRRARTAIARLYVGRHRRTLARRGRRVASAAARLVVARRTPDGSGQVH